MLYIGIDAHMSTSSFCVMNKDGVVEDQVVVNTNGRLMLDYINTLPGKKKITFEECEISHWLYEIFNNRVEDVLVCNPGDNVNFKRAKTDKLDARRLADLLRGGYLTPVYHDGSGREQFRSLVSGYQDIVDEVVRLKNRLKSLYRRQGIHPRGKGVYRSSEFIDDITREDVRYTAKSIYGILQVAGTQKLEYQKRVEKSVSAFKESKYLISIPGIGPIHAARIISQVINPERFKSKYKFFSYCGLVRHKQISAGKSYGSKKIHGNRVLKCVYKMAGRAALRGENPGPMKEYYNFLRSNGRSDKQAYQSVCRKIASISLAVWRNKTKFNKENLLDKKTF